MDKTQSVFFGKGMRIAHLNVRSLLGTKKSDMLKTQIQNSGIDIFSISETWLTSCIPNKLVTIPKYSISRLDRSWNEEQTLTSSKRGGTSMLC